MTTVVPASVRSHILKLDPNRKILSIKNLHDPECISNHYIIISWLPRNVINSISLPRLHLQYCYQQYIGTKQHSIHPASATQHTSVKQHMQPSDEDVVLMVNVSMLRHQLNLTTAIAVQIPQSQSKFHLPSDISWHSNYYYPKNNYINNLTVVLSLLQMDKICVATLKKAYT